MDWAGVIVERVTDLKLNDYMQQYIFLPLGIQDMSMFPTADVQSRLVGLWQRDGEKLSRRQYPLDRQLQGEHGMFHSGGAGLFGSVKDFGSKYIPLLK